MIFISNKVYKNRGITSILRKNEFYIEKSFTYQNIYDLLWDLRIIIKDVKEKIKNTHHNSFYLIIPISIYKFDKSSDVLLLSDTIQGHFTIVLRNFQINDNDKKIGDYNKLETIPSVLLENMVNTSPSLTLKDIKNLLPDLNYSYSFIKLNISEVLFTTEFEKDIFDIKIKKLIEYLAESRLNSVKFILYYIPYIIRP
jgi:hypothetical protein